MRRNTKKKHPEAYTFMVIPQASTHPWRFNLTRKKIIWAGTGAALAAFLMLVVLAYCGINLNNLRQADAIVKNNQQKDEAIETLQAEIQSIQSQQDELVQKQNELKKLMGIKDDSPVTPSRGAVRNPDSVDYNASLVDMLMQAQQIKNSSDQQAYELEGLMATANNNTEYFRKVPNQWPVRGEVTSEFGWRKSPVLRGRDNYHDGIDIAANSGQDVVAAGDGRVTLAGWDSVFGRCILIDHGLGLVSRYGHNSVLLVKQGDEVEKGQVIAKVGSTGMSTGPHLHFTILKNGAAQDPMIYLP